jgi:hypothetical protein
LEPTIPEVLEWYQQDSQVLVWALTSTEVLSALYRRFREGRLTPRELSDCSQHVQRLREDWSEVDALELINPAVIGFEVSLGFYPRQANHLVVDYRKNGGIHHGGQYQKSTS